MTEPIIPPSVDELPPEPERGNRSTFRGLAEAFIAALRPFRAQLIALVTNGYHNGLIAYNASVSSLSYKTDAEAAKNAAISAGKYIGEWSSLTGAVIQGESVSHNDELWMAVEAIIDITTSEPSRFNSSWRCISLRLEQFHTLSLYF